MRLLTGISFEGFFYLTLLLLGALTKGEELSEELHTILGNHCAIGIVNRMKNLKPGQDFDTKANDKNLEGIRWYCDRYAEICDKISANRNMTYVDRAKINITYGSPPHLSHLYFLLSSSSRVHAALLSPGRILEFLS